MINVILCGSGGKMGSFVAAALKDDKEMQIKYTGVMTALFSDVTPIPVKEAMNLLGMKAGPCRLPLYPMSDDARENLIEKLKECGCL